MRGNIEKRGKNSFRIRIYLGRDKEGKPQNYIEPFHGSRGDAEAKLATLLVQRNLGGLAQPSKSKLSEFLDNWLRDSVLDSVAPRTHQDYFELCNRYIKPELGHVRLATLTPVHVQQLYRSMKDRGLSGRTIRYVHNVLCRALRQAERWGLVARNVAKLVDPPKQVRQKPHRAMDKKQLDKFLEAASKTDYYAMWVLAADTGARPEEYFGLKWTDLDLKRRTISIDRALVRKRKGGGWSFEELKTPESRRKVKLSPGAIDVLKHQKIRQAEWKMKAGKKWTEHGLIFTNKTGDPLNHSNIHRRYFKPLLTAAGLPSTYRIYDLRHTSASLLGALGVRPKIVQTRLGHSSIKTTMDFYSHVFEDEQEAASDKMQDALFSKLKLPV